MKPKINWKEIPKFDPKVLKGLPDFNDIQEWKMGFAKRKNRERRE